MDRIGRYYIKKARIKIQAQIQNTIAIFKEANKDCKDMYNLLPSKKKETKQFMNGIISPLGLGRYQPLGLIPGPRSKEQCDILYIMTR